MKKFAVIITNTERASYEDLIDVHYTKIFNYGDTIKDIMNWANDIKKKDYYYDGSKDADITDLIFSYLCE